MKKFQSSVRNKLNNLKGMSIGEILVAVLIMLLSTSTLIAVISLALGHYKDTLSRSEANALSSTLQSLMTDELAYTTEINCDESSKDDEKDVKNFLSQNYTLENTLSTFFVSGDEYGEVMIGSQESETDRLMLLGTGSYPNNLGVKIKKFKYNKETSLFTVELEIANTNTKKVYLDQTFQVINVNKVGTERSKADTTTYTVSYSFSNDSEISSGAPSSEVHAFGDIVSVAQVSKVEGYAFSGWTTTDVTVTNGSFTMPAKDVTFTGKWTKNKYTITFDTDGGSAVAAITQDCGTEVEAPANPTKTGYTFDGWDKTIPTMMPAENITIKATWKINQYTITFDTDGGSEVAAITQDYGTAVTAPAAPTKTGYTFDGWDTDIPTTMPAENITIKATWKINQYTITFDTDGGSEVAAITQNYGTAVTAPENPTKTGYTFDGWDTEIPTTMPAENITIKAKWKINQYTITFDTDGGSEVAAITQDYGTTVEAPAAPTKTGYTFDGWDKTIPTTMPAENITIKAAWKINQYTITFKDGESVIAAITKDYGAEVTASAAPTKTGYTFTGWDKTVPTTMPAENITITATWTINQYTITFDTDGGSELAAITQDYGTAVTAPAAPTKIGYTFAGWDTTIPTTMPAENITIKAKWTANKHTNALTYDANGGSNAPADQTETVTYPYTASTFTVSGSTPTAYTKTGYDVTFAGWYTAAKDGEEAVEQVTVGSDNSDADQTVTLYAHWTETPKTYKITLTYDANGGSGAPTVQSADVTYPNTVTTFTVSDTIPTYTKTGYIEAFDGWYTEADGGTKYEAESTISAGTKNTADNQNVTLYAHWTETARTYNIAYELDGGTNASGNPTTYTYGVGVTSFEDASKTGYTFNGWYDAATGGNKITSISATETGAKTLYAHWTPNTYTVLYAMGEADTGEAPETQEKTYGTDLNLQNNTGNLAKNDTVSEITTTFNANGGSVTPASATSKKTVTYTAVGWTTTSGGSKVYDFGGTYSENENVTLYPVFTANTPSYTSVTLPTAEREGYTFLGWSTSESATAAEYEGGTSYTPTSSGTLYAIWKIKTFNVTYNTGTADSGEAPVDQTKTYGKDLTLRDNTGSLAKNVTESNITTTLDLNYDSAVADTKTTKKTVTYTAVGWATTSGGSKVYDFGGTYKANASVTLYPAFSSDISYSSITLPSASREGYEFLGWASTSGAATAAYNAGDSYEPHSSGTLYAVWKAMVKVTFDAQNGDTPKVKTVKSGSTVAEPTETPTKKGYQFEGWYTDQTYLQKYDFSTPVLGDRTLYARWVKTYTITFYRNKDVGQKEDADIYSEVIENITEGTDYVLPDMYSLSSDFRNGDKYINEWRDTSGNTYAVGDSVIVNRDIILYASWVENTYTLTFDGNGGTGSTASITRASGAYAALPECGFTAPTGKIFVGWSTNKSATSAEYQPGTNWSVTTNQTFYAIWHDAVQLTFYANDGTAQYKVLQVEKSKEMSMPAASEMGFAKTGYDLVAWTTATDGSGSSYMHGDSYTPTQNADFYAKWGIQDCTITFAVGEHGQGNMNSASVAYGSNYTIPECYFTGTDTGSGSYKFDSWSGSDGKTYNTGDLLTVNGNVTLTAQWKLVYTVTFNNDGSTIIRYADEGKKIDDWPTDPTKSGSRFDGWYDSNGNKVTNSTIINANIIVNAEWVKTCTVTFVKGCFSHNWGLLGGVKYYTLSNETFVIECDVGSTIKAPQLSDCNWSSPVSTWYVFGFSLKTVNFQYWASDTKGGKPKYSPGNTISVNDDMIIYGWWN